MSLKASTIKESVQFRNYSVDDFNRIMHFDDVRNRSNWLHENASIFGSVICKHGLHDVFGVGLVHKHFDLRASEYLVRNYTTPRFSISAARVSATEGVIPYIWRFEEGGNVPNLMPLEFVEETPRAIKLSKAHKAHYERRQEFFEEFHDLVKSHGAADTVALVDLFQRDMFDMESDESLYESTFEKSRYITLEVGSANSFHQEFHQKSVRTGWWFTPSISDLDNVVCMSHCYAHCQHQEEKS